MPSDSRLLGLRPCQRREAYLADITYGTNNEFGFDYLRDNMRFSLDELVQRELHYAIVDEVDSILIDEARTPLIISGPAEESTDLYYKVDRIIPRLTRAATITEGKLHEIEEVRQGDYIVDEKAKTVTLTEAGIARCEQLLAVGNLYDPSTSTRCTTSTRASAPTPSSRRTWTTSPRTARSSSSTSSPGRLMPGRRWSDGLHQAIEAKEGLRIQQENQTLATITFQNYFRMYDKLAGMTGTADTEAAEFAKIYKLDVTVIPTNRALDPGDQPGRRLQDRAREVRRRRRRRSRSCTRRGGRSSSAPSPSRSRSGCPSSSRRAACPTTRCSTPSTTRGKPRSSPRRAGWGR